MSRIVNKLLSTTGGVSAETDEFFNETTLLLHGDGTNGSQNNTFIDSSANGFTITRNGNTTQGSYSPYGDRWSNYFDGTGDYFSIADDPALEIGSGDFTIEFWYWADSWEHTTVIATKGYNFTNGYASWLILRRDNGGQNQLTFYGSTAVTDFDIASRFDLEADVVLNQWNHYVVCREGGTLSTFANGVRVSTKTTTQAFIDYAAPVTIMADSNGTNIADGYLSDFRFIVGSSAYDPTATTITVPTEPLTAVTGTSLLTCQSNRFKDNSSNDFAITVNGDTKVTPFSPYAPSDAYDPANEGGSGYFDGTGDYLSAGTDTAYAFGTGDFTIECWFYAVTIDDRSESLVSINTATSSADWQLNVTTDNGTQLEFNASSSVVLTYPISAGQWYHVAVVRSGSNLNLYLNGIQVDTTTNTNNFSDTGPLRVGVNRGGFKNFNGYISDVRIIKGTALYTSDFTPPTAPLTAVTNTSLLCNFTNAGIFDSTGKNVLETVGNAQIDTSTVKYGTGSMEFDGTGDYLVMENSESLNLAGVPWTIEAWLNPSSNFSTARIVFAKRLSGSATLSYQGYLDVSTGNIGFSNGSSNYVSSSAPTANTWNHCAWVYDGANINIYLNGTSVLSSATAITEVDTELVIGAIRGFSSGAYLGYIDDLRITKGVARYTANFTPPTKAFPDQ